MQVQAMGFVWYRKEDYESCRAMFPDGSNLPDTYDEWLVMAQSHYDRVTARGMKVVKAYIDPDTFPEWCRTHNMPMDTNGRNAYANERAYLKFKNG
jgi:hypothetical protein